MIALRSKMTRPVALAWLCVALSATPAIADSGDPILTAMERELSRAMAGLGDAQYPAPYYVAYSVKDLALTRIVAKQGAPVLDDHEHSRQAYVDVRVGDYHFDNSEDADAEWAEIPDFLPLNSVPLSDSTQALQHALWLLTDLRYKQAAASYLRLKGRRLFEAKPTKARVSHAQGPAAKHLEPLGAADIDLKHWRTLSTKLSAQAAAADGVFDSEVEFRSAP